MNFASNRLGGSTYSALLDKEESKDFQLVTNSLVLLSLTLFNFFITYELLNHSLKYCNYNGNCSFVFTSLVLPLIWELLRLVFQHCFIFSVSNSLTSDMTSVLSLKSNPLRVVRDKLFLFIFPTYYNWQTSWSSISECQTLILLSFSVFSNSCGIWLALGICSQ